MPKGKPWSVEEERQLQKLRQEGKTVAEIAHRMNKSPGSIKQKLMRLGLKVVVVTLENQGGTTTSPEELILPKVLPSVEEALLKLAAAMKALENPKLSKTDIMRLKTLIQTSTIYQKRFAEYVNYRRIEQKVIAANERLEEILNRDQAEGVSRIVRRRGSLRARTDQRSGSRAASFVRPNIQAEGEEVNDQK